LTQTLIKITSNLVSNVIQNNKPYIADTPGGDMKISHYKRTNLFDFEIKFFLLPPLKTFDAILGRDTMKGAQIGLKNLTMTLENGKRVVLNEKQFEAVCTISPRIKHLEVEQRKKLNKMIDSYPGLFEEPNQKLAYTTSVRSSIRTRQNQNIKHISIRVR